MGMTIIDKLTPGGSKFLKELNRLASLRVKVGFRGGSNTEADGADVCQVAVWNEFGTSEIPSRPFMRQSTDNHKSQISDFMSNQKQEILNGADAENILKELGIFQKGIIQEEIVEGTFTPNAPSTVKKKGSSRPLIDTGLMRQSVQYLITKKGGD